MARRKGEKRMEDTSGRLLLLQRVQPGRRPGRGQDVRRRLPLWSTLNARRPGGVESYAIDLRGERHELTPRLWTEVYLSAHLRAILYADDPAYRLAGYRRLDPIRSLEDEMRFLAAAEQCFAQGWQLGSDPEVQVATAISNHLTAGIMRYFGDAYRYGPAVNLFEKLLVRDPEVAALLARSYIGMGASRGQSPRNAS